MPRTPRNAWPTPLSRCGGTPPCWRRTRRRYHQLQRHSTLTLDDGLAETLGEIAEFDRAASGAEDTVGALVAAFGPPDREIFLRRYYLLQSVREIAAALGMSAGAVNVRLHRGRERLRRALQPQEVDDHA